MDGALEKADIKLAAADLKQILKAVSWRVETAPPVIAKIHKPGKAKADPLRGLFETTVDGKPAIVEYEPDADLRDTEQVPLLEDGGIEAFIRREVLPHVPTPGSRRTLPRSATKSASPATSTSRSRCARSKKSAPRSSLSRRKPRDY